MPSTDPEEHRHRVGRLVTVVVRAWQTGSVLRGRSEARIAVWPTRQTQTAAAEVISRSQPYQKPPTSLSWSEPSLACCRQQCRRHPTPLAARSLWNVPSCMRSGTDWNLVTRAGEGAGVAVAYKPLQYFRDSRKIGDQPVVSWQRAVKTIFLNSGNTWKEPVRSAWIDWQACDDRGKVVGAWLHQWTKQNIQIGNCSAAFDTVDSRRRTYSTETVWMMTATRRRCRRPCG